MLLGQDMSELADKRGSTVTRLRFVAPPGMEAQTGNLKKIGRYEIIKTLGKGAMGVVYKARDPYLDRTVAVKTISSPKHGGRRAKDAYVERFQREAKAAAKMQHPGIVTIFDVGVDDKGAPFMVLEYLPGESLADRLDMVRIPLGLVIEIGKGLASSLAFAHKQRIVHRDVKPANVLHAGDNRWKLADFGIARLPNSELTQVGIFMGTPGYAPPESIREGVYTVRADVFAWGAVFYEVLCGRIPYEGPDTASTNQKVVKALAKPPREYDRSIPEPLSALTMRALHPDPEKRFRDGAEVEAALEEAWQFCLQNDMVSAKVLTKKEVAHNKAPAMMHSTEAVVAASPSGPPPLPPPQANTNAKGQGASVVVASRLGTETREEDPTRLVLIDRANDDIRAAAKAVQRGHALIAKPTRQPKWWLVGSLLGTAFVLILLLFLIL